MKGKKADLDKVKAEIWILFETIVVNECTTSLTPSQTKGVWKHVSK